MVFQREPFQIAEVTRTAEQSVIGAIILEEKSLARVIDIIQPEDFYYEELKACYETVLELSSQGKPIDFVTILNHLLKKEYDNERKIKELLINCTEITPSISNVEHYANIVVNSHKVRKLQSIGSRLSFDMVTPETANEIAEKIMSELFEVIDNKQSKKLKNIGDIGIDLFENYTKQGKPENRSDTGFTRLDKLLKGMFPGNLIILAARPKVGKTAFALSIAENVAKSGKTVAFFSLEMESSELYERLLSKRSGVPMNTLIDKRFNDKTRPERIRSEEINRIATTTDNIYTLPLKINDKSNCTANDIRIECRMIKNLGLIVIDYLQLIRSNNKYDNRNLEIGAICRDLKCLAAELGVPILCLSQLNRTSCENLRPSPTELRDSGSIEQDANKVMLMWCIDKNLDERGFLSSKTIGVDVALNRRGTTGVTLFNFNGNYMKFKEIDRQYEEPKTNQNNKWKGQ